MKKMSVLIVSSDKDYCFNVAYYFKSHFSENTIITYISPDEDIAAAVKNNNVYIIITDAEFVNSVNAAVGGKCAVYTLTEDAGIEEERTIPKYISAPSLYSELLFIYSNIAGKDKSASIAEGIPVYCFVSMDSSGATTLSASLAFHAAYSGKKVIYIGLDGLSDYYSIFPHENDKGMSDLIASYKSSTGNVAMTARSVINHGVVDFVSGCKRFDDMFEINSEECSDILNKVIYGNGYDMAVIDISYYFRNLWDYAAKNSSGVFAITNCDLWSAAKMNSLLDSVHARDFRNDYDVFGKLTVVINNTANVQEKYNINCERIVHFPRYSGNERSMIVANASKDRAWVDLIGV
ncbi:hypothetical protein [Ruminococcus sp.]|uniref:hypothetical protein n=1 Tax=Ruminococcus sp. TaxID=41978 RepID=UPI0025D34471|nr:hypothetical protein [Ruminococcus sp.]MBR1432373.1 hypothetical protein [Ruminococcus sp.]